MLEYLLGIQQNYAANCTRRKSFIQVFGFERNQNTEID